MKKLDAEKLLQKALDDNNVRFRDGQWEAIDAIVNEYKKVLVVQRTGWGKSSVYFISSKILRDRGKGITIIISPLLALMRNQIESAKRLGITAETINSSNTNDWDNIANKVRANQIDCLLISPERLANEKFLETVLLPIADKIALFVIDEAHCISDWGHDFRPDYRRIINILKYLPENMPILGTTATANNRVIDDIKEQLGNINIQRGTLVRDSLALQTLVLPDQASRLAWLAQVIPTLDGTGIIYALTVRDVEQVAKWLQQNNINAKAYHGGVKHSSFNDSNQYRAHLEDQLLHNQLKVLVATTALGMGYDKPDLSFVIHYQASGSVVDYYQQVGRAGRGIDHAVGILMTGAEDTNIHEYFRASAFPTEEQVAIILSSLENSNGLSMNGLEKRTNLRRGQIEKTLKFLSVENISPVIKIDNLWHRTPNEYRLNKEKIDRLSKIRLKESAEVQVYIKYQGCKMRFLRQILDDVNLEPCGKCEYCIGRALYGSEISPEFYHKAALFLKHSEGIIEPRKQSAPSNNDALNTFPIYKFPRLLGKLVAQEGRYLSSWGDSGWGKIVAEDKKGGYFRDELVDALVDMIIKRWQPNPKPQWVCCVPSLRKPVLVADFARRVAQKLDIPFINVVEKIKSNEAQKIQQNSFHQAHNLDGVFSIKAGVMNTPVLLIDDIVDSKWTSTVIAALLIRAGSGVVYPVMLASTAVNE